MKIINVRRGIALSVLTLVFDVSAWCQAPSSTGLLQYVQPLVGTANSTTLAATKHGEGTERLANTIPAVGVPFGMTQWTPQTRNTEQKCAAPYYYKDNKLTGFRGTHWLSGSCTQDYGSFTIMPVATTLKTRSEDIANSYSHDTEIAAPDYYCVNLENHGIKTELTALARSSIFHFTTAKTDSLYILVMPNSDRGKGFIKIDRQNREITGYNPAYRIYQGSGLPAGFSGYFVIQSEKQFGSSGTFVNGVARNRDSLRNEMKMGAYIGFNVLKGEVLKLRIGTSFTSIEEARKNLKAEITSWDFNTVRKQSAAAWEKALQKIQVTDTNNRNKTIFYTEYYHSMQHPRLFNDADGSYPKFAHQYENDRLITGRYFDDFSMWDIYRAQLPLFEILDPALISDLASSIVTKGKQGVWLPIFPCWNSYTGAMIGDHATAFLASAWIKGIRNFDIKEAYRLMRQNAFNSPTAKEYIDGKGRRALPSYLTYNYIPMEDTVQEAFHKQEQVSRTLEYAFDDYALSQVARDLRISADYKMLLERSKNYRLVFDTSVSLVRGRYADGSWFKPFYADRKLPFITEGTPRQYTFYVPHDIAGLAAILGGTKMLEISLDSLFNKGEYWHGNEPGHQIPFMYNYTVAPWKTQQQVRQILLEEYSDGPGGLSGNDDAGQMSAWYVFAAMGLYPVNPASDEYILSSPIFDKIKLSLAGGKTFEIITHKETPSSAYIRSASLNGRAYNYNFIRHKHIMKGGRMELFMGDEPVKTWASLPMNRPGVLR